MDDLDLPRQSSKHGFDRRHVVTDIIFTLASDLLGSIMTAAGTDAYEKLRDLVLRRLGSFRERSKLEQSLDSTRNRLQQSTKNYSAEFDNWTKELTEIIAAHPAADRAMRSLRQEIINLNVAVNQTQTQHVNITISGQSDAGINGDNQEDEPKDEGADEQSQTSTKAFIAMVAIVVVFIFIVSQCGSDGSTSHADLFPKKIGHWPAGATAEAVLAPVARRLAACAEEPLLSPVNCPQSQPGSDDSSVSGVHWSLDGDATDGARVVYVDRQFQVAGNAVMSVEFTDSDGAEFHTDLVHYRAWVDWNSGRPTLTSIIPFEGATPPSIVKHEPHVEWAGLQGAVLAAFRKCASAKIAPLPPACPTPEGSDISGSHAHWQLDNNPVLNAQEHFNKHWGYMDITGTYSMSATYSVFLLGKQRGIESGNYDAIVTIDGSRIHVLQIMG
jgi:hypothetical protein